MVTVLGAGLVESSFCTLLCAGNVSFNGVLWYSSPAKLSPGFLHWNYDWTAFGYYGLDLTGNEVLVSLWCRYSYKFSVKLSQATVSIIKFISLFTSATTDRDMLFFCRVTQPNESILVRVPNCDVIFMRTFSVIRTGIGINSKMTSQRQRRSQF